MLRKILHPPANEVQIPEDAAIILTGKGEPIIVDAEDHRFLSRFNWCLQSQGYAYHNKLSYMHRFLLGYPNRQDVDHINGVRTDNRLANLRICSRAENSRNTASKTASASLYKGVYRSNGCGWRAAIRERGRQVHLGCFRDEVEAANAYDEAARRIFGAFARLNFPREGERSLSPVRAGGES